MLRRCPWCGGRGIFSSWFKINPECPTCGLLFEAEEGAMTGSMIITIAAAEVAFLLAFGLQLLAFWPDVPWGVVVVVCVVVNAAVPFAVFPMSKTIWSAVELLMHRMDPADRSRAAGRGGPYSKGTGREPGE